MLNFAELTFVSLPVALCFFAFDANTYPQDVQTPIPATPSTKQNETLVTAREKYLLQRIDELEGRVAALESRLASSPSLTASSLHTTAAGPAASIAGQEARPAALAGDPPSVTKEDPLLPGVLAGTTLNFNLDGYYGHNFNRPVGQVNLMRAYDVSSNSFSLNQAGIIVERAADPSAGRRLGHRLGLMFEQATETLQGSAQNEPGTKPSAPQWHYGGFVDLGYMLDFNHPSNRLFRNRGTTPNVDELDLNMGVVYVKKDATDTSRWGAQLTLQGGKDSEAFGFSATAPNLAGAKWLRHLGPANVSYLAPVGKGLTLQAGIFNSLIGYDSLYAKDNFNYTRPWGGDFTPYLMLGVNASYPLTKKVTGTVYALNGYWHLAHANNVPSAGGQLAYQATDRVSLKETLLYGPHQSNSSLEFWRFFSDTIIERKGDRFTVAFEYQAGTERVAVLQSPRAFWTSAQLPVHWTFSKRWSVTVRPETYWDRDGRLTGFQQLVKANTTTLEYRIPYRWSNTILRLEYRYDDSRGKGGGFFKDGEVQPGVVGLTPTQHLLILGLIWTFDSR